MKKKIDKQLIQSAGDAVLESGSCTFAFLLKRLKVGYAAAAAIAEELEKLGVIGEYRGSHPRDVIMTPLEWQALRLKFEQKGDTK